jgi:NAD(P)-dependent dehydrogenase (short-subunit alcohol dehydrogenase family)
MTPPRRFDSKSTTDLVLDGIDLAGKIAIVTGASGGLGAETARALASRGAAVTLTARDVAKAEQVAASIRAAHPGARLAVRPLTLDRPDSVRAFAKGWLAENRTLHLLLDNAGVMACPLARTPEGWEMQFATNHLGHFLLTALLVPALRAGAPARVAITSSGGHRFSPVVFEDIHFERRPYDKWAAYGQSKTANVLHAVELDRRLAGAGVRAFGIHPGMIITELGRHLTPEDIQQLQSRAKDRESSGMASWKTPPQGAATQCWAVTAPELEGRGGLYLEDCQVSGTTPPPGSLGAEAWALDPEAARRLWSVSEETLGERFPLA